MILFRNVVFVAAIVGLCAGLVMTAMQTIALDPIIAQAEGYERAAGSAATLHAHADGSGHHHDAEAWTPEDGLERLAYSALASIVASIGFALILISVSELAGGIADWRHGLFWGLAGFVVFALAPGLGLAPELPAMPAADLQSRQIWWVATAAATALGLALIFYWRTPALALAGLAVIVLPHLIGAPQPESHETPVPADLHHRFVVLVTVTNLIFWAALGVCAGLVRNRLLGSVAHAHKPV